MILICCLIVIISLMIGNFSLDFSKIMDDGLSFQVFFHLRLPRVLMGLMAGFVLGVAGSVYQLVFKNPLASPDLTGVASGASLGAALMIVLGAHSFLSLTLGAFVFGVLTLFFVVFMVKLSGNDHHSSYILSGIIVSSLCNAGIMIFKAMADPLGELAAIEFWTMGSLASITLEKMLICFVGVIIPLVILLLSKQKIILLSLGDQQAAYLGLHVQVTRIIILLLTTWVVSCVISFTGVISFVGLIAPHIAYLALKTRTKSFLWMSGLIGSVILLVSDIFARVLLSGGELPLSIFTILFSTPVLIFVMMKKRGQWL